MIGQAWARVAVVGAVVRVLWMWPRIAVAAGMGRRTDEARRSGRRWAPSTPAGVIVATRPRLSDFPRVSHWRISPYGWQARIKLRVGDTAATVAQAAPVLRDALRAEVVASRPLRPGWCTLVVLRRDPLLYPPPWAPALVSPDAVRVAVRDDGEPFVIDFKRVPHLLAAGITGSGKSSLPTALVTALAPTDWAIVGADLKHGVEMGPLAPRLSRLATTPAEAVELLDDLLEMVAHRALTVKSYGVKSVHDLPAGDPARRPVLLLVDEVAELILSPGKSDPQLDIKQRCGVNLWRLAALSRFAAIYMVLCAQRLDSNVAPQVTAIRSQLGGRLCGRADADTIRLTFGQEAPKDAIAATASISPDTPGVMVALDGATWCRLRTLHVPTTIAAGLARQHADRAPAWPELVSGLRAVAA